MLQTEKCQKDSARCVKKQWQAFLGDITKQGENLESQSYIITIIQKPFVAKVGANWHTLDIWAFKKTTAGCAASIISTIRVHSTEI